MTKTIIYLLILVALATGVYFLIFKPQGNVYGQKEAGFTIKDTGKIGKIFIASAEGETLLLERKPGKWLVNGKYPALASLYNLIMKTLGSQEALYPVPAQAKDNAIKYLSAEGIKVEVYDRDGKKMSVFYVGGIGPSGTGTNMLMEGASTPYVVQIPLFNGSIRGHYPFDEKAWRDRIVFDYPNSSIASVAVNYVAEPVHSYTLSQQPNETFALKGAPEVTTKLGPLNTRHVQQYLSSFTKIYCEGFLNGTIDIDSTLKNTEKMSTIDVTLKSGATQHVAIYWMPINRRSKNLASSKKGVPDKYDADRMFAITNNNQDTLLIQTFTFRKLLRKAAEFYDLGYTQQPRPAKVAK